jgi:hypothetical protein
MIRLVVVLDRDTLLVSRASFGSKDAAQEAYPGIELWPQEKVDAWSGDQILFPEKEQKRNEKRKRNAVVLA